MSHTSTTTQETLRFVLELLRRIPKNHKITARELHEQILECGIKRDLRSVQRQLDLLSEQYPIERDERSKPYGYRWMASARVLSIPMLSEQESLLLCLCEQYLKNLLPTRLMSSMEGFFNQARYNLDYNSSALPENQWLEKVRIVSTTQPMLPPKIDERVFEAVSCGLYADKWLTIDYKNAAAEQKTAEVMPLGLAQQGVRLYLVCRFKGYDNERSLALHRMLDVKVSSIGFERPSDFDLQQYDNDGRFGFGEGGQIRLQFNITRDAGAHLLETPLSTDQQVQELDNGYQVTASVVDSKMLTWWLQSFGKDVSEVVKTRIDG